MVLVLSILVFLVVFAMEFKLLKMKQPRCRIFRGFFEGRFYEVMVCGLGVCLGFSSIINIAMGVEAGKSQALLAFVSSIAALVFSMFEFRMVGEGLFEEGIVIMGIVYDWKNIVDYQIKPVSKREGWASMTILVKKKSGKNAYRMLLIPESDYEKFKTNMQKGMERLGKKQEEEE
ncbi:MAG: hypothetical protein IJA32_15130 [Lachnospiraceae bacterium]|nr:hypothetical protein [Lachnospiraceae bacterium]